MTRAIANGLLFALIGGVTAAVGWPDDKPLGWRFWCVVALGTLVAVKAFLARSGDPLPDDATPASQDKP